MKTFFKVLKALFKLDVWANPELRGNISGVINSLPSKKGHSSSPYQAGDKAQYVAQIMSDLNGSPTFSIHAFRELPNYVSIAPATVNPTPQPPVQDGQYGGYAISHTNQPPESPVPPELPKTEPESQISLFYLLQHYNKGNAAMYKQQKERKKSTKDSKKEMKKADKKGAKKDPETKQPPRNFAVPGQEGGAPESPSIEAKDPAPEEKEVSQSPVQTTSKKESVQTPPYQGPAQVPLVKESPAPPEGDETLYFRKDTSDETIFMGQEAKQCRLTPHLLRKRNGDKILITKPVFRLGRDADFNDYAIIENRYIGHGHCHILCRNGEYFVVDDHSKNFTLVNGEPIKPGVEVKIAHGDVICIADEEFEFKRF